MQPQNQHQAKFLARYVDLDWKTDDDPMLHVQALRSHLYKVNQLAFDQNSRNENKQLELLERMKMVDLLNEFVVNYRNLLMCASTPLPFPLIQMAR